MSLPISSRSFCVSVLLVLLVGLAACKDSPGSGEVDSSDSGEDVTEPTDDTGESTDSDVETGPACGPDDEGHPCGTCGQTACVGGLVECVGDDPNVCGGCEPLPGDPGESCEEDGVAGQWVCDGDLGTVICAGGPTQSGNACGGEGELDGVPGEDCGPCDDGEWRCAGRELVRCVGFTIPNVCGSCGPLVAEPGDVCGCEDSGEFFCEGGELRCTTQDANECGGCQPLGFAPGDECTTRCGNGVYACAEDKESVFCDTGEELLNACGGCGALREGGEPGEDCGPCSFWECTADGERTVCVESGEVNSCGGCAELEGEFDEPCDCDGRWICNGPDEVVCTGFPPNACGGCSPLIRDPGESCGLCGEEVCDGPNALRCEDPGRNECFGCGVISGTIGAECGCGGELTCAAERDRLVCTEASNACGGCGPLEATPGSPCGQCGAWACDGTEGLRCEESDEVQNACGGCEPLAQEPGESCGQLACSVYECSGVDDVVCRERGLNLCGGCGQLAAAPGSSCGDCGIYRCSADGSSVTCEDAGLNACGGCGPLPGEVGEQCGPCEGNVWECLDETRIMRCGGQNIHPCGGCALDLPMPGTPCRTLPNGVLDRCSVARCGESSGTIECLDLPPNACGGCAPVPGEIGDPCGDAQCNRQGELICQGDVPVCSVSLERNECGGCDPISSPLELDADCGVCGTVRCTANDDGFFCDDPCA